MITDRRFPLAVTRRRKNIGTSWSRGVATSTVASLQGEARDDMFKLTIEQTSIIGREVEVFVKILRIVRSESLSQKQSGSGGHYLHPHHLTLPVSISAANLLQSSAPSSHCECCAATVAAAAASAMAGDASFEEK